MKYHIVVLKGNKLRTLIIVTRINAKVTNGNKIRYITRIMNFARQ